MSLLVHLLLHFKIGLETSVKGSHFAFDSVDGMYYKCYRISLNYAGSDIKSPDHIKNKKSSYKSKKS